MWPRKWHFLATSLLIETPRIYLIVAPAGASMMAYGRAAQPSREAWCMRRPSRVFLVLMAIPLIGVVASHASLFTRPSQTLPGQQAAPSNSRMGLDAPSTRAANPLAYSRPAGQPLPATAAAPARAAGFTVTRDLPGAATFPLAALMVFFAAGGIFLLRTIARMMI